MKRLLDKLIIKISYDSILDKDVETVLESTRESFRKEGYAITEIAPEDGATISTNMPDYTDSIAIKSTIFKLFKIEKDNIGIFFSKEYIELNIDASELYEGFEVYFQEISTFIHSLYNVVGKDILSISRVSIRKINKLYLYSLNNLDSYFDQAVFGSTAISRLLGDDVNTDYYSMTQNCRNNLYKVNIASEVVSGVANQVICNEIKKVIVYRCTLDIESYWDVELKLFDDIEAYMFTLNQHATDTYEKCLNSVFLGKLKQDETISDENVFGGIK